MSDFRNTKRLNYAEIENLIDYPISEGQTYFAKDAGVFFKDIHGQRFATLEVDSLDNLNDPDFFIGIEDESNGTKEKLKGRILLIKTIDSDAYEWYYIHPEDGQIISLSSTDRLSAGVYKEPEIDIDSYPGSQEFTVSTCCVNLFATVDHLGPIKRYTLSPKRWTDADAEWPPIGATRYVVVNYNGGSPEFQIISSVASINESNIVPVFTIVRTLNNIHYIGWNQLGAGLANKMHARFVKTQRFARESGLSLSSTFITTNNQSYTWASGATLNTFTGNGYDIKISSGVVWNGAVRTTLNAADSKVDKLRFYFHDTNGNWTYTNTNTIINRRQYDQLTTGGLYVGLTDLGATARYGVAWVYRGVLVDNYIGYMLSNNYYSKTEAINSTPPVMLPDILQNLSVLVGKVVFSYIANGDIGDVQVINITGIGGGVSGGSGGVVGNHNDLNGREATNAHPMSAIEPRGTYPVLTVTSGKNPSDVNLDEVPLKVKSLLSSPLENLQEWWTSNTRKSYIDNDGNFSGKAAKAGTLSTPRAINGVNFDGSANIVVKPPVSVASDNQNYPIIFSTSGTTPAYRDLMLVNGDLTPTINPSTGAITASVFNGTISGNATSADQIKTGLISTNADYFLTFVNENSAGRTNKNIYTNVNIKYNPALNGGTLNVPNLIAGTITATDFNIVHAEDIYTENDHITLRDGATSALAAGQYTGLIAKIPDGSKDAALVFDGNGMARVGDIAYNGGVIVYDDTQALATRHDTPTSNSLFYWNASQKRMDSSSITWNGTTLDGTYQISISGVRKDTLWDTAYAERGSQIGGNNLTWNGTQLDVDILDFNDVDFADQNLLTISSPTFVGLTVNSLILKGTSFNTTLTKTEPTAARTITFPNASGTVVLSDGAVTSGFVPVWNGTTGGLLGDGYKVQDSTANAALSTNADLVTERDVYYGLIRVNNATQTRANIIYAPTTGGVLGYTLIGAGATSAPTWTNLLFHDIANSRVGIGTVAPTKLLDVNGEARVRNQLTVDSIITIGNLIIQDTAPADPNSGYIDIKFA